MPAAAARRWAELLTVLSAIAFYAIFIARTTATIQGQLFFTLFDDPMISMRYARNLAQGHGLVWNAGGARVEGYTNLLWTLWMALLHLFPVTEAKISLLVSGSGLLLLVVNLLVVRAIAHRLAPDSALASPLSMALVAVYYPLVYWTLRGFEVGLLSLLISLTVLLALRLEAAPRSRDTASLAAILAAMILTRPDAVVPAAVVIAWCFVSTAKQLRWRIAVSLVVASATTLAAQTAFRLIYYGEPLPNTYYLKVGGVPLLDRLHRGFDALLYLGLIELYPAVLVSFLYLLLRRRRVPRGAYLLAALFAGQCAYSVYVGADIAETAEFANRYIAIVGPQLMVLAVVGVVTIARSPLRQRRGLLLIVAATSAAVTVLRWVDVRPAESIQLIVPDPAGPAIRVLLPGVVTLVASAAALFDLRMPAGTRARRNVSLTVLLTGLILVSIVGREIYQWGTENAYLQDFDTALTQNGLLLRSLTDDHASIAFTAAGSQAYFSDRPAVDLLGKSDAVIAHGPSRERYPRFQPGHAKWNYEHSVAELRPDVIFGLYSLTDEERSQIVAAGYQEVAFRTFLRSGSPHVDRQAFIRAMNGASLR